MSTKRIFDLILTIGTAIFWLPTVLGGALLVLLFSGRPAFYRSQRRVSKANPMTIVKFRTMVRNAAEIANRSTVPVDNNVRFLNIPSDSVLYTKIGRIIERFGVTELPQFVHVLSGKMSIIGNRPLPEAVMDCLREEHLHADDRFLSPAGLTGPVQLVGRQALADSDRLALEGAYSRACLNSYSALLDLKILFLTIFIVLGFRSSLDLREVHDLIDRHSGETLASRRADAALPITE